jgi:hypothetical protein
MTAGDFPFGYDSYNLDADWAEQLARRGPKPKKGIKSCDADGTLDPADRGMTSRRRSLGRDRSTDGYGSQPSTHRPEAVHRRGGQ